MGMNYGVGNSASSKEMHASWGARDGADKSGSMRRSRLQPDSPDVIDVYDAGHVRVQDAYDEPERQRLGADFSYSANVRSPYRLGCFPRPMPLDHSSQLFRPPPSSSFTSTEKPMVLPGAGWTGASAESGIEAS